MSKENGTHGKKTAFHIGLAILGVVGLGVGVKSKIAFDEGSKSQVFFSQEQSVETIPSKIVYDKVVMVKADAPQPKFGFQRLKDGSINYLSEEGRSLQVPPIPGLTIEIIQRELKYGPKKVIYLARKENPYGLKEGEYAGKFNPNVWIEEQGKKQTGGLVLINPVIIELLKTSGDDFGQQLTVEGIPVLPAVNKLNNP